MFLLIPLLVVAAFAHPPPKLYDLADAHNLFKEFVQKHSKVYNPEEYSTRLDIFKQNLEEINERNARYPQNEIGINHFTDLTAEERREYLGFKRFDTASHDRAIKLEYPAEAITAPEQFDWRDHDVVVHVKDQGRCQASWIFSAIGNMEGQYAIKHKTLISLSEQQVVDCFKSWAHVHSPCMEGWPHDVMSHFQLYSHLGKRAGIASESEYPYTGKTVFSNENENCQAPLFNKTVTSVTTVTEFQMLIPKDEETLKQVLYETGPLAVAFDSSELFEYSKGIYVPHWCQYGVDHSALLVGYGIENGTKYWTLKNSWGEEWGEKGYFRLIRGKKACHMGLSYTATCTVT